MAISFDVIDKFTATIIDFWTLRPRKFLESVKNDQSRYLSPPQFLLACLSLISALDFIVLSFYKAMSADTLEHFPFLKIKPDPAIVAGRQTVFLLLILVAQSLIIRGASWWPIKSKATLKNIMYYQFYSLAVSLLFPVLDVILIPLILNYIDSTKSQESINLLHLLPKIYYLIGIILGLIYSFPGYAKFNRVSTWDMYGAVGVFWLIFQFVIIMIMFFSFIIYRILILYIL
jgi:hypothetical protein